MLIVPPLKVDRQREPLVGGKQPIGAPSFALGLFGRLEDGKHAFHAPHHTTHRLARLGLGHSFAARPARQS